MATVGYYDMSLGQGGSYQVNELTGNGHTAVNITLPNAAQLAGIDTLYVTNPSNTSFGAEYLANQAAIAAAVQNGMNLVIFDRFVTNAQTILPGGSAMSVVRNVTSGTTDVNIAAGAPAAFTAGITNSTFDGGNLSSHGFVTLASLPPGAVPLMTRANPSQVVAFTYPFGSGTVFYSTIPLDFYSNSTSSAITPAEVLTLFGNVVDVVCFAAGTRIMTVLGEKPVEDLRPGDLVRVLDGSHQPLRWVGQRRLGKADLLRTPLLYPVKVAAGALGLGLPKRDILASRQHRMLIASAPLRALTGHSAALVAACKLVGLPGIAVDQSVEEVTYFHLLFDRHQVIWAEGAPSESLLLGPEADKTLTRTQAHEIAMRLPSLAQASTPALPILTGRIRKSLMLRHQRSGRALIETLPVPRPASPSPLGALGASAQGIARAAHRTQRILAASRHQRFAEPAHMHIHRAAVDVDITAPHAIQELLAAEHPARTFHQA
jgi:hypothetical protein